jgi:vacuolar-type H+-ATPase subunit H
MTLAQRNGTTVGYGFIYPRNVSAERRLLSETSPVEAALKNLTTLEASLDELRNKVEARKLELLRLAQESGEAAYNATLREAEGEKTDLVDAIRKSAEKEAGEIVEHGHAEMEAFNAKAKGTRDAVKALVVQILLSEA